MLLARILNIIAIILCGISLLFFESLLIYLSIAFLVASIILWRVKASKESTED
jgi:hypothetical protein